ncbi:MULTISPECIES: GIY-YIG nuclease family protein [unclassified Sphingopyxis]|uniref:GIY-YIG nuclease family protein n=1 Tax=unclassified Sphingopyxis TaxID=2614943 RepID=UPI002860B6DB|nr:MULTISPECIES: GIY-YIG nuclease family protein [unclassified Sphingopyxis]MDR6833604.1 hypothetical protein [Sphingopyxis sp. BE122]MDR7225873.1 hypothetical protein [Sphingopyxis sp. BE259]
MAEPGFIAFELDLMGAVMGQIIPTLDALSSAPLTVENASGLPEAQGVYLLLHGGEIRYVGKTDAEAGLRTRIARHARKFEQRRNVQPHDVCFKAAQILVLTAMDIESKVIAHYGSEWNGSGFGSNDPGRERETTNKPEQGFDAQFPIDIDIPLEILKPGTMSVHQALILLKAALPYTLRYEVRLPAGRTKAGSHDYRLNPHPDMVAAQLAVSAPSMTVRETMRLIVSALPQGWQATYFVSHVILYKEDRTYLHGVPV